MKQSQTYSSIFKQLRQLHSYISQILSLNNKKTTLVHIKISIPWYSFVAISFQVNHILQLWNSDDWSRIHLKILNYFKTILNWNSTILYYLVKCLPLACFSVISIFLSKLESEEFCAFFLKDLKARVRW